MIYCVIPPELEDELFDRLTAYYEDNPDVTVIVDRRTGPDRRARGGSASASGGADAADERRTTRDRRRARIPGTFLSTDAAQ